MGEYSLANTFTGMHSVANFTMYPVYIFTYRANQNERLNKEMKFIRNYKPRLKFRTVNLCMYIRSYMCIYAYTLFIKKGK